MKAFYAAALGLLVSCYAFIACEAASVSELKGIVEGIYILDEFHNDEKVFRPPQVEGRLVILNGNVMFLLVNKIQETKRVTTASLGVYTLQTDSLAYRYDNPSTFTETSDAITVTHAPPWEGMRNFAVTREGDTVRARSRSAEQAEALFTPDGMRYSEGGNLLRVYRRVKSE